MRSGVNFRVSSESRFSSGMAGSSGSRRGRGSFGGNDSPRSAMDNNNCSSGPAMASLPDQVSTSSASPGLRQGIFPYTPSNHRQQLSHPSITAAQSHSHSRGAESLQNAPEGGERRSIAQRDSRGKGRSGGYRQGSRGGMNQGRGAVHDGCEDRIYYLGRLMTSILRHRALELDLNMRNDGFVKVEDLLKLPVKTRGGLPLSVYSVDDVLKAVETDNKQRFGLLTEDGSLYIRANQGHSLKAVEADKLLRPVMSPNEIPVCVHGTFKAHLDSIMRQGLKTMGRNHVHFASGLPNEGGVISGMRSQCEVLIYLNAEEALRDGMKLFISDNGVILTEGFDGVVPSKYFAKVCEVKKGKDH